jgi:hypothetical protein
LIAVEIKCWSAEPPISALSFQGGVEVVGSAFDRYVETQQHEDVVGFSFTCLVWIWGGGE